MSILPVGDHGLSVVTLVKASTGDLHDARFFVCQIHLVLVLHPAVGGSGGRPRGFLPVRFSCSARAPVCFDGQPASRSKRSAARSSIFAFAAAIAAKRNSRRSNSSESTSHQAC